MEIKKIDNYIILERISKSMSILYKAKDIHLDKLVALKLLPEEYEENPVLIKLFQKEFKSLAQMDHPNITRIYHAGKFRSRWYFVMEWVEGLDLKKYILKSGILDIEKVLIIVGQIAHALNYAHKSGIIHRDIKSSNILIKPVKGAGIKAYLTDFGIAKDISQRSGTVATGVIGTADYIPPEQALAKKELIGPQSDVYSLGIVVYEMLTGRVPFKADSDTAVIQMHINTQPPMLHEFNPTIRKQVERVTLKALEKHPAKRFASAGEFYLSLKKAVETTSTSFPKPTPVSAKTPLPAPEDNEKYKWVYPAAAGIAILIGTLMFFVGQSIRGIIQ